MKRKEHLKRTKGRPGVGRQRGGVAPIVAAMIPALAAGGKAVTAAGLSALTSYGTKKAINALEKKKYKRKRRARRQRKT